MGTGRGRRRSWMAAAAVAALMPAGLAAQAVGERLVCKEGDPVGSLGITGIKCDRCQFYTNGKVHQAVFWTEPTILDISKDAPAARVLRPGDVIVAVDGELITTREGSARFSALPPDEPARLRIRRDGRLMELDVPVSAECPTAKSAAPFVAGRPLPLPALPSPPPRATEPTLPTPPAEPAPVTAAVAPTPATPPALPAPAPLPARMAPHAALGFGFRCSECVYREENEGSLGRWTFPTPPEVVGVVHERDAAAGDLHPGDRLLALDGADLTTDAGARRFSAIRPGDRLVWTVERDGKKLEVASRAGEPAPRAPRAPAAVADAGPGPLRFSGTVGNATVEVRGGRVSVTEDEDGRLVIIRTSDTEIRIRVPGGDGGS